MLLARVVGNVWGARQADGLQGYRLLVARPLSVAATPGPSRPDLVVADRLGAGPGELVLVAHGSRCRDLTLGATVPTKEVTVAIVNQAEVNGELVGGDASILGRVVGTVWATRKDHRLSQDKLLLVRPYFYYNPNHETEQIVAVDRVDAGVGDDVVVCIGAPARWSLGGVNYPVDAAVLGVVDRCQLSREAFGDRRSSGGQVAARPLSFIGGEQPRRLEWIGRASGAER